MEQNQYELVHYGVLGMKWGIRKARRSENAALRKSSRALGKNRRDAFMDVYKDRKADTKKLEKAYDKYKTNRKTDLNTAKEAKDEFKQTMVKIKAQRGRSHVPAILGTIGVFTVAAVGASVVTVAAGLTYAADALNALSNFPYGA